MSQPPNLGQLIDRQVSRWDSKRSAPVEGMPAILGTPAHRSEGPWITVSTQLGAGGRDLAARLGSRLGWQVFDKEILQEIARNTNTRDKVLSRLDEHAIGALEDYVNQLFVPGSLGQSAYVVEMTRVVWAIARHGEAIVLGRGANWLLDPRFGVRVRAVAPIEKRVEWLKRTQGLSTAEAIRRVEEDNEDRARFTRQVFRRDIDDPLGYDLVVNLGTLETDQVVGLILAVLASKSAQLSL